MTGRQGTPWSVRCNIIRVYSTSGGTNGWMGWGVGVVGIGGGWVEVWGVGGVLVIGQPVLRVKLDQSYLAAIKIFCSWSRSTVIVNIVLGAPIIKN